MEFFLKGLVAGFIIAVPIGPVAVLCFQRVLKERLLAGLATVLGAATADAIYGLLAALGLKTVAHLLLVHHTFLRIGGGLLIIGLGVSMFRARPSTGERGQDSSRSLAGAYFSTLLLMLANPTVMVSLLAVFAALDLGEGPPHYDAVWAAGGVLIGSALWWFIYRLIAVRLGHDLKEKTLRTIDQVSGSLICLFGVWELISPLIFGK
jgi:threonine/homoserine/homoserine lactone efflux protein